MRNVGLDVEVSVNVSVSVSAGVGVVWVVVSMSVLMHLLSSAGVSAINSVVVCVSTCNVTPDPSSEKFSRRKKKKIIHGIETNI